MEHKILEHAQSVPRNGHFYVAPNCSGGSPALVSMSIALSVAEDEVEAYERCKEGTYGEELKRKAEAQGLAHIVYARWEKARKVWRRDLLTGELFIEPKRLEHEELERLKLLRHNKELFCLSPCETSQLNELATRARIHHQNV